MQPAQLAIPCVAALGLLLFVSGFFVSVTRARFWTLHAGANDPAHALTKAVRAHGNTAEYAAFLALLIWLAGQHSQAAWVGWTMLAATVSRYAFVAGMLLSPTLAKPHPLRAVGAFGTYLCGPALSIALLLG
jgi:uncharacterized membrane protein YecN with MAPEG domain